MQLPTGEREALPHRGESRADALFLGGALQAASIVGDLELDVPGPGAQRHRRLTRVSMSLDVAQRFLRDSVQGCGDRRRDDYSGDVDVNPHIDQRSLASGVSERLERARQSEIDRYARMERPRHVPDFFDAGPQQLPDFSEPLRSLMTTELVHRGGDLKVRGGERLTHRIVQLSRHLSPLALLGVNHFRTELTHPLP